MQATRVLLELAGNVVLLLWGLHMVQSGLTRALGGDLRRILGAGLRNRWTAFLSGMGITMLLQSSTATGLMATGFTANGLVSLMPALAVMLGANVGSTLIVQVLAFDVAHVAPVLLLGSSLGTTGAMWQPQVAALAARWHGERVGVVPRGSVGGPRRRPDRARRAGDEPRGRARAQAVEARHPRRPG